jgi:hypothetical protein
MVFTTKEEFARDSIRFRLTWLKGDNECLEIPRDQYEKLDEAMKEMVTPFHNADHFINSQMNEFLEKYKEYKKNKGIVSILVRKMVLIHGSTVLRT